MNAEHKRLVGIIRSLREIIWHHHEDGIMVPDICPVCTEKDSKWALKAADEILDAKRSEKGDQ